MGLSSSKRQLQEPRSGSEGSPSKRGKQIDYEMPEDNGTQSHSNSVQFTGAESMETHLCNSHDFAEVVIDVNITPSSKNKSSVESVLLNVLALKNSCGGIIRLNIEEGTQGNFEKWATAYYSKEKEMHRTLGESDAAPSSCLRKGNNDDNKHYIFIKKTAHLLTERSNILRRLDDSNETVNSWQQIDSMMKRRTENSCLCISNQGNEIFHFKEVLPLGETRYREFKSFPDDKFNLNDVAQKVKDNACSFANTGGGTLYIGVSDKGEATGQRIAADDRFKMEEDLKAKIKEMIWLPFDSKQAIIPEVNKHYKINFIPVQGTTERVIIVIHICSFHGTVFVKKPICKTIDDENQVIDMEFDDWLLSFRNLDAWDGKYQIKNCHNTVYKQLKETIIEDTFQDLAGQIRVHPKHAAEWIQNDTLKLFIDFVNETFKERGGHAFVQKSWYCMLGKPLDKPDNAICDILLCLLGSPLALITLTDLNDSKSEVHHYNRLLAAKIKRELAQEAGCFEEFFVRPLVLGKKDINSSAEVIFRSDLRYPPQYSDMPENKYANISKALALVIARVNSSVTYEAQQKHFNVLTKEQYSILDDCYRSSSIVHIQGLPGTGKTVLAIERIYKLRLEGCRRDEILFVCSNKPLAAKVRNIKMPHDKESLCLAWNYFRLIKNMRNQKVFNLDITHIMADEVHNFKKLPSKDIPPNWWEEFLAKCRKDCSTIWFFSDFSQKITMEATVEVPRGIPSYVLKTVIRMTEEIYNFCTRFIPDIRGVTLGHDIQGAKPEILIPSEKKNLVNILVYVLKSIAHEGHALPSICVLFTDDTERRKYKEMFQKQVPDWDLRSADEVKKKGIIFDTIRRDSGDEHSVILGFCPRFYKLQGSSSFQDNKALMAALCSRAQLKLILVFDSISTAKSFGIRKEELQEVDPLIKRLNS